MRYKKQETYNNEKCNENILEKFFLSEISKNIILTQGKSKPYRNYHKNGIHMKCNLTHHFSRKPRKIESTNCRKKKRKIKRGHESKNPLCYI